MPDVGGAMKSGVIDSKGNGRNMLRSGTLWTPTKTTQKLAIADDQCNWTVLIA